MAGRHRGGAVSLALVAACAATLSACGASSGSTAATPSSTGTTAANSASASSAGSATTPRPRPDLGGCGRILGRRNHRSEPHRRR